MITAHEFEAARPGLTALAFRLLGSLHDAEDAVQGAWIKSATAQAGDLYNPAAWLTTVLTRVCLDQLRLRHRRREEPLPAELIGAEQLAADEHYLRRESVSRALMVVLGVLSPSQRVAYVLHDLFDVPFQEIARTLDISADSAKQHASRARKRIAGVAPATDIECGDEAIVTAFLDAAAGGDFGRMIDLMTDDCVRIVDAALVPPGTPTTVTGASEIARETTSFADRIRASTALVVGGRLVHVIAPGGHPFAIIDVGTRTGQVTRISISRNPENWNSIALPPQT